MDIILVKAKGRLFAEEWGPDKIKAGDLHKIHIYCCYGNSPTDDPEIKPFHPLVVKDVKEDHFISGGVFPIDSRYPTPDFEVRTFFDGDTDILNYVVTKEGNNVYTARKNINQIDGYLSPLKEEDTKYVVPVPTGLERPSEKILRIEL